MLWDTDVGCATLRCQGMFPAELHQEEHLGLAEIFENLALF